MTLDNGTTCSEMMTSIRWPWITTTIRPSISQHSPPSRIPARIMNQMPAMLTSSSTKYGSVSGLLQLTSAHTGSEDSMMATLCHKLSASGSTAQSPICQWTSSPMPQLTLQLSPTGHTATDMMEIHHTIPFKTASALRIPHFSRTLMSPRSPSVLSRASTPISPEPSCGLHTTRSRRDGATPSHGTPDGSTLLHGQPRRRTYDYRKSNLSFDL
jgi:hypothetical protein